MADLKVAVFDWDTGEFLIAPGGIVVTAQRNEAVAVIVQKAARTERGLFTVYADDAEDLDHKYGSDAMSVLRSTELDESTRVSEIARTVEEAIIYDPYIKDVTEIVVDSDAEGYVVTCSISTIYDSKIIQEVSV